MVWIEALKRGKYYLFVVNTKPRRNTLKCRVQFIGYFCLQTRCIFTLFIKPAMIHILELFYNLSLHLKNSLKVIYKAVLLYLQLEKKYSFKVS